MRLLRLATKGVDFRQLEAEAVGSEDVRGTACRHIAARTDLERASEAGPVEIWLDDHHIRRVRVKGERRTETVELWDFGVSVDGLDWTRLPTFKSPDRRR